MNIDKNTLIEMIASLREEFEMEQESQIERCYNRGLSDLAEAMIEEIECMGED